jgi:hypothetical protein
MNCQCEVCMKSLELGRRDVAVVTTLHNLFPAIRLILPPLPPFRIGDTVKCTAECPIHGFRQGEAYKVESLFLSTDKKFWFIRAYGMPSSTSADQFELGAAA